METKLMAVMFADVSGFTKFSSTSRQESISAAVEQFKKLTEPVIARHRGRIVKWIGDAAMVVFDSATDSIFCGYAIQRTFLDGGERSNTSIGLGIKAVVNVGDVAVDKDGDVYGAPVNFCSRMEKCADPDEVFFSEAVRNAIPQAEIPYEFFGEFEFKGISGKQAIYRTCFGKSPVLRERILLVKTDFVHVLALADSYGWDVVHPALDQAIGMLKSLTRKNDGTFRGTSGNGTLVTFSTMRDALLTFHEWREAIQNIHRQVLPENSVQCRVAMHVGTLHLMEHTLMGRDIHIVETLTPLGNSNDVLMTEEARKLFDGEFRDASGFLLAMKKVDFRDCNTKSKWLKRYHNQFPCFRLSHSKSAKLIAVSMKDGSTSPHSKGQQWNHNQPFNQDGYINQLIDKGKGVSEIIREFSSRYPEHKNPKARVRRHLKHLFRDHPDFPYEETPDGGLIKKKR